jgi:hypothetical protein
VPLNAGQARVAVLQVIADQQRERPGSNMHAKGIVEMVGIKLNHRGRLLPNEQTLVIESFYELFQIGHLSWGWNRANSEPPSFHVTSQGLRALQNLSRDPSNPTGYRNYLSASTIATWPTRTPRARPLGLSCASESI